MERAKRSGGNFFAMGQLQLDLEDQLWGVIGKTTSIQAEIQIFCPGANICKSSIYGQIFYTNMGICKGNRMVSFVNCIVECINGQIWVNQHDQSSIIYRPQQSMDGTTTLIETCAGIGAVGHGFREHGMHTAAYCDNNQKFCSWLRNHTDAKVIEGNINEMQTIEELSKAVPHPHVINGGVSCQPFSSLGDKGEGLDSRSQSFTGLLKAAFHLQSLVIVMECTPGVKESSWAQNTLKEFTSQTGYHLTQTVLEMHHVWPSVRNRWWAVLTHPAIGPIEIQQMPNLGWDPSVFHLMPRMMKLDPQSITQLELDLYELRHFHNQPGGIAKSAFDPFTPMPTATHSWGSQVKGCHCGCRASGFSEERVANRGLYGVLIPLDRMVESAMGPYHAMRHPHPMEVALINGLEPAFVNTTKNETLRLALAGVGQLASPLQSVWVWGHVRRCFHEKGISKQPVDPCKAFVDMCKSLFIARDELLNVTQKTKYMEIFEMAIQNLCVAPELVGEPTSDETKLSQMIQERCIELESAGILPMIDTAQPEENEYRKGKGGKVPNRIPTKSVNTPKELSGTTHPLEVPGEGLQKRPQTDVNGHLSRCPFSASENYYCDNKQFATNGTGGLFGFETSTSKKRKTETEQTKADTVVPQPKETFLHIEQHEPQDVPDEVSPTVPWTEPVNLHKISQAPPVVAQHHWIEHQSYNITVAGEIPASIGFKGDIAIEKALAAEVELGNALPQSTIRTCVGTFVAPEQNIRPQQTYIIFPSHDRLNDEKRPKTCDSQIVPDLKGQNRVQGLYQQKGWVAFDEMQYYLGKVAQETKCNISTPFVLPNSPDQGVELARWILRAIEIANASNRSYTTMTTCLLSAHWIPIKVEVTEEATIVTTLADDLSSIRDLLLPFKPDIRFKQHPNRHAFPADCGFQAVAWIKDQAIGSDNMNQGFPMTATEAGWNRDQFAKFLRDQNIAEQVIYDLPLGGMPDGIKNQLHNLLVQHGVSTERVNQCADNLIEHLGNHAIQKVLGSPNAWKDLKVRASQHSPPIKIVLAEELKKIIDDRIDSGKTFGRKQNKENQKPKASVNSWKGIKASQVNIPHTVFKQDDGELISQISVHQFHPKCKGIAVVNINEALPFCQLDTPLSSEGVGMIIVDYQDPRIPAKAEIIQFPAICEDTGDSMLVLGALMQLGQKTVGRNPPANCSAIEEIPTSVVRTMVYKDQFNKMQWDSFVKGPVKAIMDLDEFRELPTGSIIDVWDRQYISKSFQKTKQDESDIFIVSIRCTQQSAEKILDASGRDGVYHEPRTDSGRSPHANFGVVWLPKKTYGEAIVLKQTSTVRTWIVRNGDRYGLRTNSANHQSLHSHHKPEVEFLAGETISFRVGPLPYGTTRGSLQKVIKEWEWTARPVQPQGQVHNGVMWLVQANQIPPFWVYTMSHGDILITQIENGGKGSKQNALSAAPLASQRTLHHLTTQVTRPHIDKSAQDPFQVNDPWAPANAALSSSQIANIETQVEKRVMAQVQPAIQQALSSSDDAEMIPAVDDRVSQLESQIKQINENMQKSNQSFQVFQQQQMQQNQAMTHQISNVKQQVDSQYHSLQTMLDSKMEDQMSRIEALLVKRMKVNE